MGNVVMGSVLAAQQEVNGFLLYGVLLFFLLAGFAVMAIFVFDEAMVVVLSCLGLSIVSTVLHTVDYFVHRDSMERAVQANIQENFHVHDVKIEEGLYDLMYPVAVFQETPDRAVLNVVFQQEDSSRSQHSFMYHHDHELLVPLSHEATAITPYIRDDSALATLLAERSPTGDDETP